MRWVVVLSAAAGLTLLAPHCGRAESVRLTMDDAVARALANNPDLAATRKENVIAEINLQRSSAWFPSNPYLSGGAQSTTQSGVGPNYTFFLSQEVEVGGQRGKRIEAAEQGVEKARWNLKSAEQTLAANVKTAFVEALVNNDRIALARRGVEIAAQLTADLQKRSQRSDTQQIDLNVAQVQESRARRELAGAEQAYAAGLAILRRLVVFPFDQELELTGAPQRKVRDLPAGPELVKRALQQRPDLTALRHDLQRTDLVLALTKREAIPNVTLSGSVSRFEGDTLTGGDIGIPLPIFRGRGPDVNQAIVERTQASLTLQDRERSVAQETLDARRTCVVAGADLQASQRDIVPKSEENLRIEQRLYARGVVTASDLVGIQIDLLTARREELDALQTHNDALIELERVIGGPIDAAPASAQGNSSGGR